LRDLNVNLKIFAPLLFIGHFCWDFPPSLLLSVHTHLQQQPYKKVSLTPLSEVRIGQCSGRTERTEQTYCNISLKISPSLEQFVAVEPLSQKKLHFWKWESGIIWLLDKKKSRGKIKYSDLIHLVFQRSKGFVAINHN